MSTQTSLVELDHVEFNRLAELNHLERYLFYGWLYPRRDRHQTLITETDVFSFLSDWFPRKAMWASVSSVKSYLALFKKFFKWMGEADHVSDETVVEVIEMLKEGRAEFLDAVSDDGAYW